MPLTRHAMDRINDDQRFTREMRNAIAHNADIFSIKHPTSTWAVRIARLDVQRNPAWGDVSNGDTVVAIVREGWVTTVFLRRSTQPWRPEAMDVQHVWPTT